MFICTYFIYRNIIAIIASPAVIRRRKEINIDILLKHELFPRSFNPCHSSFAQRLCTAHIIVKMILFYMNSSEHIFTSAICSTSRIRQKGKGQNSKNFNKSRCHINQHSRAECIYAKYASLAPTASATQFAIVHLVENYNNSKHIRNSKNDIVPYAICAVCLCIISLWLCTYNKMNSTRS